MNCIKSETTEINGVIRIKIDLPYGVKFVCIYLFEIDGKRIMIDAGFNMPAWKKKFLQELEKLNIQIKDIDYLIITHEHPDHCGLLKHLKIKNPNLQILMHKVTEDSLKFGSDHNYDNILKKNALKIAKEIKSYGMKDSMINRLVRYFLIWPKLVSYEPANKILNDDDEINFNSNFLKVIWTPGHSLGHICIYDAKKRTFFSGDHILSSITPHIGVYHINSLFDETLLFDNILDRYFNSLQKILKLNSKIIFPAHQEIITNPKERILEIQSHHQEQFEKIMNSIEKKPLTPYKLSQIHFGTDLDDMNSYLALNEILSHLIYLEHKNKVQRIKNDGKILFQRIM